MHACVTCNCFSSAISMELLCVACVHYLPLYLCLACSCNVQLSYIQHVAIAQPANSGTIILEARAHYVRTVIVILVCVSTYIHVTVPIIMLGGI